MALVTDSSPEDKAGAALVAAILRARRDRWPPGTALRGGNCLGEGDAGLEVSGVAIGVTSVEVDSKPSPLLLATQLSVV